MALALPISTDKLNAPDHSALHRVIAVDPAAAEQSIKVESDGVATFGQIPVAPASDPTTDNQIVRKAYVDSQLAAAGGGGNLVADFEVVGDAIAQGNGVYVNNDGKAVKGICVAKKIYGYVDHALESDRYQVFTIPLKLSATKICCLWLRQEGYSVLAQIVNYSDNALSTVGGIVTVQPAQNRNEIDGCVLTPTLVVACAQGSGYLWAYVLTISGDIITVGGQTTVSADNVYESITKGMSAFNTTQFIIFYTSGLGFRCKVGTVSGSSISYGSQYEFGLPNAEGRLWSVTTSETQVIAAYKKSSNGYTRVGTRSGTTMSFEAEQQFCASPYGDIHIAKISATQVIVVYATSDKILKFKIGTISGVTITWGTEYTVASSVVSPQVTVFSETKFAFDWCDFTTNILHTVIGELLGGVLYLGDVQENGRSYSSAIFTTREKLDDTHYALGFHDRPAGSSLTTGTLKYAILAKYLNGIAKEAKTAGQSLPVILGGLSNVHSGLAIGSVYYANDDGTLGTTKTLIKVGRAVSATSIILKDVNENE